MKTDALDLIVNDAWVDKGDGWVGRKAFKVHVEQASSELAALKARIAELEAERTWQPIERIPRTGEEILLKLIVHWNNNKFLIESAHWNKDRGFGVWETNIDTWFIDDNVVGWMPLPPTPKED